MLSLQLPDIPVVLGPTGTVLLGLVVLAQTAMAFYSWRRSTSVQILKGELDVYKGKVARLEDEQKRQEEKIKGVETAEEECRRKLDRLTALYLESKGEEEDERRRGRRG